MMPLVVAIVVCVLLVYIVLATVRIELNKSLSLHIAESRGHIRLAQVALPVVAYLVLLGVIDSAQHYIQLLLLVWISISIAIMGLIPYAYNKISRTIHDIASYGGVLCMWLLSVSLVLNSSDNARIVYLVILGLQSVLLLLRAGYPLAKKVFLPLQLLYLGLFAATLFLMVA